MLGGPTPVNTDSRLHTSGEQDILHHDDAGTMQLLHHLLRGDADSTDEQFGTALDDDVREGW